MGRVSNTHLGRGASGYPQISLSQNAYSSVVDSHKNNPKPVNATGEALKNRVSDTKLKTVISELYRPGATIGDGGAAAALLHEKKTGKLVGGKSHEKKVKERLLQLNKMKAKNNYKGEDKRVVNKLIRDLEEAIKYNGK